MIRFGLMFALAIGAAVGQEKLPEELDSVARVASVMVDGDVCRRIETPASQKASLLKDPSDPWRAADNYEVDHAAFLQAKNILTRLSRLCTHACGVNLWMPPASDPSRIQMLVRTVQESSQFWIFGALHQDVPPAMKKVLDSGERASVSVKPGMVSVLAPVFDSLGDIVAVVEVVSDGRR